MTVSRFLPLIILSCAASLAYGGEETDARMAQEVLDEVYLYGDFPQLSEHKITQRLRLSYHQLLQADPLAPALHPPLNVMVLPVRARASWDLDGQECGSWGAQQSEALITGITEDYLLEGQLPVISVQRQERAKVLAGDLVEVLEPVLETAVEDYFGQVPVQLLEGADVYTQFPRLVRCIQEDLASDIQWQLIKEDDEQIVARTLFHVEALPLTLENGNLDIRDLNWIPHIALLAETFEELLSLVYIDDADVTMQIKGAIEGLWNPLQLLEHHVAMNYTIIFECEVNHDLCRLEVDLFRQLSSK